MISDADFELALGGKPEPVKDVTDWPIIEGAYVRVRSRESVVVPGYQLPAYSAWVSVLATDDKGDLLRLTDDDGVTRWARPVHVKVQRGNRQRQREHDAFELASAEARKRKRRKK